jgi:hypothetical protein
MAQTVENQHNVLRKLLQHSPSSLESFGVKQKRAMKNVSTQAHYSQWQQCTQMNLEYSQRIINEHRLQCAEQYSYT